MSTPEDWWLSYVALFLRRHAWHHPGRHTTVADLYEAFLTWWGDKRWWATKPKTTPTPKQFASALAELCRRADVAIIRRDGTIYCQHLRLEA